VPYCTVAINKHVRVNVLWIRNWNILYVFLFGVRRTRPCTVHGLTPFW
jgi:hypothetical protein